MITLITGGTGDGKTALAVKMMLEEYKGRPIYAMGIPDLAIEHTPTPPVEQWTEMRTAPEDPSLELAYFTFPENSVIFLDEGQRVFRPRHPSAKVPPEVQAFETHRHCGIDWVIITQFPQLLDNNIRRLVKRHIHIHATALGKYRLEWPLLGDPEDKSSREIAAKTRYTPPKEVFGLYKSAEVHTKVKRRIPWFVYAFFALALVTAVLSYRGYQAVSEKLKPDTPNIEGLKHITAPGKSDMGGVEPAVLSAQEYFKTQVPRVPGLLHTAPRYDEVTKVTEAPFPAGCIIVKRHNDPESRCRCLDQQGNDYPTTQDMCRHVAMNGIFKEWGTQASDGRPQADRPNAMGTSPIASPIHGAVPSPSLTLPTTAPNEPPFVGAVS